MGRRKDSAQKQEMLSKELQSTVQKAFHTTFNFHCIKNWATGTELHELSKVDKLHKCTDSISKAILISQILLREHFRNSFTFTFSKRTFKRDVKAMWLNWLKNRDKPFTKVIDTFAIIAEAFLFCDINRDYNLALTESPVWFVDWFNEHLSEEFYKAGGWDSLDLHCKKVYLDLHGDVTNLIEKNQEFYWKVNYEGGLIGKLRNSQVMFPVPDDLFPTESKWEIDEKVRKNIVCYRTLNEILKEQRSLPEGEIELPPNIIVVRKKNDRYVYADPQLEKSPIKRKITKKMDTYVGDKTKLEKSPFTKKVPKKKLSRRRSVSYSKPKIITEVNPNISESTLIQQPISDVKPESAKLTVALNPSESADLNKPSEFTISKDAESKFEMDTSKDITVSKELPSEISQVQDILTASDKSTESEPKVIEGTTLKELFLETEMSAEISQMQRDILKESTDENETLKELPHSKELLSESSQETDVLSEYEESTVRSKVEVSKELPIAKETLPSQTEVDLPKSEETKTESASLPLPLKETEVNLPMSVEETKTESASLPLPLKETEVDLPMSVEETKTESASLPLPLKETETSLDSPIAAYPLFPSKLETATPYRGDENLDQVNKFYLISEEYFDDLNQAVADAESKKKEICLLKFEGHPVQYKNDSSRQMLLYNQSKCYFLGGSKKPRKSSSSKEEK